MKKFWTKEDDDKVKELVSMGNYSFSAIGKILGRSGDSCRGRCYGKLKIKRPWKIKALSVNENFWTIPNPINSYYSGFAAADACVTRKTGFKLCVQKSDEEWLQKFLNTVSYSGAIKTSIDKRDNTQMSNLFITSKSWIRDLERNFSVVPQKTYRLAPPNLTDNHLQICWLIGILDGDGCIGLQNQYRDNKQIFSISIHSSSKPILEYIKKLTNELVPQSLGLINSAPRQITKETHANCYRYAITGFRGILLFELLKDINVPKMDRKWKNPKILEYISNFKQSRPELFNNLTDSISQIPPQSVKPVAITNLN